MEYASNRDIQILVRSFVGYLKKGYYTILKGDFLNRSLPVPRGSIRLSLLMKFP